MSKIYDVVILGAGPAGLAAGLYAGRARMSVLIVEKGKDGGQIAITDEIENYPGQIVEGESGPSLIARMTEQCEKFGVERVTDVINDVVLEGDVKKLISAKGEYCGKTLIIATGAFARPIGCKGEKEFMGKGVSYCATCDANFFEDFEVYVVGGGDSAVEEAMYLTKFARKVTIIHRRDELRAEKILQDSLFACHNVELVWDSVPVSVEGEDKVTALKVRNVKTDEEKEISVDGVFIAVGIVPGSGKFKDLVKMDESGYIIAGEDGVTSTPGIFAAGDIRTKNLRQVVTAVADGANAVASVQRYLMEY